ncbi:MAG: NUDIX domain-containing protein [Candidatus Promineifilaceae bacterium]
MRRAKVLGKVSVFVTRGRGEAAELLLFRHPTAGIQLPAGTLELGETPEQAARREALEETGLDTLRLRAYLGSRPEILPAGERRLLRASKLFDQPSFDASSQGQLLTRGMAVIVSEAVNGFCAVEVDGQVGPLHGRKGYVRRSLLTDQVERHFYHFEPAQQTPATWEVETDGHIFRLFWAPLTPRPSLHPAQQGWLDAHYQRLL